MLSYYLTHNIVTLSVVIIRGDVNDACHPDLATLSVRDHSGSGDTH